MSKVILLLLILGLPGILPAQEQETPPAITKKIQGSKELPLELNLLIDSLQKTNNESLLPIVLNIDSYARLLSKEDIFLVGKIEIYKTLLKTNDYFPKATVDGDSIKTLRDGIKKATDPFISWFLSALLRDCESLINTPSFKDYLLQKNNGRLEKLEFKKIDKKVQLLYRWISKVNPDSPDFQETLRAELVPVMLESLKNIEESYFLMAINNTGATPPAIKSVAELKFFSLKEVKPVAQKPAKKEKTVDDILAPITDEGKNEETALPEPSREDWLNDDNAPTNLKNLPKPSNDADWLQDF